MKPRSNTLMLVMAYLSLGTLGAYNAQLGVVWPSIRETFGLPLDALGIILVAGTAGFFLASVLGGTIITRFGAGVLLVGASALGIAGTLGFALAPAWWTAILAHLLAGLAGGSYELGTNTFVVTRHGAKEMNWLHAFYGVGATLSPLLITALLDRALSWRWGYATIMVLFAGLLVYFLLTFKQWQAGVQPAEDENGERDAASSASTLRLAFVWMMIVLFFVYTGVEVSVGQWSFTLLTESRAIAPTTAGVWVSLYWGSFTAGRFLLGFIADRIAPNTLLRASILGAILGAALLWWNPTSIFSLLALGVMGVSFASIYPGLMTVTPQRISRRHVANALGFEAAAAGLGAAGLPALAGVLADGVGLEVIAPFLLGAAVLMLALYELSGAGAPARAAVPETAGPPYP